MDQAYENLFVGDVNEADNPKKLEKKDVDYILNLSGASPETKNAPAYEVVRDKGYVHYPISDDGENSDETMQRVIELAQDLHNAATRNDSNLLIHCATGASRSVALTAAVMSLNNGKSVHENVNRIKKVRALANPHPELAKQVNRVTADIYND